MMDISEKAGKYAEGKANEAITKAIEQAYKDGYRDGYKDREEEIPVDLKDDKTEYVDLGLPSGTLWAKDCECDENGKPLYLTYAEAQNRNLPTEEQTVELIKECNWHYEYATFGLNKYCVTKALCVGPSGNTITFSVNGRYVGEQLLDWKNLYFWFVGKDHNTINSFIIGNSNEDEQRGYNHVVAMFKGYKLPVIQVR